jgi:hypothetical protein
MKTINLFLLIACIFTQISVQAQTTYLYNSKKTFYENGYTYQCDVMEWNEVRLYNKENKLTYTRQTMKDGSPMNEELMDNLMNGNTFLIEEDNWTRQKCLSIVNNSFSSSQKSIVKGETMFIDLTLDTSTGKVIEVDFSFMTNDELAKIPVSAYRKIELELKNNIWFTLTPTGKQLNFVKRGWMHEIR